MRNGEPQGGSPGGPNDAGREMDPLEAQGAHLTRTHIHGWPLLDLPRVRLG